MFEILWNEISKRPGVITVQNKHELEHVFNLIQGCESYLEIGTAEGNSLFVLSHALKPDAKITYIDFGEKHTTPPRNEIITRLNRPITGIHGNSNSEAVWAQVKDDKYDVVFIDAGHSYENVKKDAALYGPLAKKYIIFHDVALPDVRRAFDEYTKDKKSYRFVLSDTFGYGIVEI